MQDTASFTHFGTLAKIASTAVVASAALILLTRSPVPNRPYYMVDELVSTDLSRLENAHLKVHGWVVPGSIKETVVDHQIKRTFLVRKNGKKMRVFSSGPKSDAFRISPRSSWSARWSNPKR